MKIVAVSQRVDVYPELNERRDALDQNMSIWLHAAGFLPFPVPNRLAFGEEVSGWLDVLQPVGLILSGGNDIGTVRDRDFTEELMMRYAEQCNLPLLGIGRGMQMIARANLIRLKSVNGHVGCYHTVQGEISGTVNSYHQFCLEDCPPGFRVLARSEDGVIEAIRHDGLRWEGWMWQPEKNHEFDPGDIGRVRALFA